MKLISALSVSSVETGERSVLYTKEDVPSVAAACLMWNQDNSPELGSLSAGFLYHSDLPEAHAVLQAGLFKQTSSA